MCVKLTCCAGPAHLVREVVAVHLVAVGLASWTFDLDAMAL